MFSIFKLKNFYILLLKHNLYYFLLALFLLACSPLFASMLFDFIVFHDNAFSPIILLIIVAILICLLISFISISVWSSIKSNLQGSSKLMLIVSSYIMLWFTFGNLYYFFSDVENYLALQTAVKTNPAYAALTDIHTTHIIKNMPFLWNYDPVTDTITAINRSPAYLNSLYFSGTTMLTIGYGDFIPLTPFTKMLTILQAFLGQFINVVAIGIWLNNIKK